MSATRKSRADSRVIAGEWQRADPRAYANANSQEFPSINIISCAILSMTPHPRLSGRVDAVVRAHLTEIVGGLPAEHSIDMRLRVSVEPGDHADRVKELVLAKAAKILRRVNGALESTSGEAAPEMGPAPAADPVPDEVEEVAHDQVQDLAPATEASDSQDQDEDHPTLPAGPPGSLEA
ncbi:MAG: hypothetical protein KJ944_10475 [Alphaproteobacteria bacterium]|nr:hypothetical protein [Alphaproteobacteria bacterium]MBU2303013.1 hypothetical protein [Alphaproteobacteria bacterium]MBU2368799.1 hypothetical protein [Alphaproteobacteria bacterium]